MFLRLIAQIKSYLSPDLKLNWKEKIGEEEAICN